MKAAGWWSGPICLQCCESSIHESSLKVKPVIPKFKTVVILLILGKTRCMYCIGEKQLIYNMGMHSFERVSHMVDHVENVNPRHVCSLGMYVCCHPECAHLGDCMNSLGRFHKPR